MNIKEQKFQRGNLVRIADDLGPSMDHFTKSCDAIVVGSYADQYGGDTVDEYTVILLPSGTQTSWYEEHQLTLIDEGGEHLIKEIKFKRREEAKRHSSLVWIKENWKEGNAVSGTTLSKLGEYVGCGELWGRNGEGLFYYTNAMKIMFIFNHIIPKLTGTDEATLDAEIKALLEKYKSERLEEKVKNV